MANQSEKLPDEGPPQFSAAELESYLDEALPLDRMAAIEAAVRCDPALAQQLAAANARRDAGLHSLGAIWRRHRASCPTREQLGGYLLGALPEEVAGYVRFHLETVSCRYCRANLTDLESRQAESEHAADTRRRRYFQSSAGYLQR